VTLDMSTPEELPTGRVALVTGAGRGIGRAVAERLARTGHRVALTARSEPELRAVAADLPGEPLVVPGDLTEPGFVQALFAQVERELGPVEVLVANAGAAVSAPLARTTDELWDAQLAINLTAPFRCVRRAVPPMVDAGWGRVVVMASAASKAGAPYVSAYTAAKHGVLGLVRSAAAELAGTGVTVNAVCPGYVDTPMTDGSVRTIAERTSLTADEARSRLAAMQPIGRLITPGEVADVVALLVTSGAITGQGINVDGGAVQS
jgi:NAD(P)-dependent dehydrogenase (short-subunit alcohol dehydrogenase family)